MNQATWVLRALYCYRWIIVTLLIVLFIQSIYMHDCLKLPRRLEPLTFPSPLIDLSKFAVWVHSILFTALNVVVSCRYVYGMHGKWESLVDRWPYRRLSRGNR